EPEPPRTRTLGLGEEGQYGRLSVARGSLDDDERRVRAALEVRTYVCAPEREGVTGGRRRFRLRTSEDPRLFRFRIHEMTCADRRKGPRRSVTDLISEVKQRLVELSARGSEVLDPVHAGRSAPPRELSFRVV